MAKAYGVPTPSQLEKINQLAKRPLEAEDVFVFSDKAIGDGLIPSRFMRVDKSLLNVFKADAISGVSMLIDHCWASFGILTQAYGRTFDAQLKKTMDTSLTDETWALNIDHYMVRGREKKGISTDQLIADIEDGTIFDTSIGFGNETYVCSICGNDYMDYRKCEHFRGQEYDGEVCTVLLKPPGFLMENSLVFDGAYPGARILSPMSASEVENTFDPVEDIKGLEPGTRLVHTFSNNKGAMNTFIIREPIKGIVVPNSVLSVLGKEEPPKLELANEVLAAALAKCGLTETSEMTTEQVMTALAEKYAEEVRATIELSAGELKFVLTEPDINRALGTEVAPENWAADMVRLSQEGRESRQELINDTLEWGVRAYGNEFARESYKEILSESGRTIQAIKDMREQFKKVAADALATGRTTKTQTQAKPQATVPDAAFKI